MGKDFLSSIGGIFQKTDRQKKSALTNFQVCGEGVLSVLAVFFMRFFCLFFLKKRSGNKGGFITTNCRQFDGKTNALDEKGDFGEKRSVLAKKCYIPIADYKESGNNHYPI